MALKSASNAEAQAEIRRIIEGCATAINNRNLTFDYPIWSHIAADVELASADFYQTGPGSEQSKLNCEKFLEDLRKKTAEDPEYYVHITAVDVHVRESKATAWVNQNFRGIPAGLVRSTSGLVTLRLREGKWYVVKYEVPLGMGRIPSFDGMDDYNFLT